MSKNSSTACATETIKQFLNEELGDQDRSEFERHLDFCDECCNELNRLTAGENQWEDVATSLSDAHDLSTVEIHKPYPEPTQLEFLDPTDDPHMIGRFANYEIVGVIGVGGMGIVLKGFDRALNRFNAIKVLKPHYASSIAARRRFAREARAAAAVVHENVIAIHGVSTGGSPDHVLESFGNTNGRSVESSDPESVGNLKLPYLVMPYIRGESLQKRIDRVGPFSTSEVLRVSIQIANGLAAAHEQGLVHRDIKPANILLPDGVERAKITDFGLARAADDASLTRTGVIAGTPQYMSPEQARGEAVNSQSDLFSLGSVMYYMCSGRIPFRAETPLAVLRRIVEEDPRPIKEINPDIPTWLATFIAQLHNKEPSERPNSAASVAQFLTTGLAHTQNPTSYPHPEATPKTIQNSNHSEIKSFVTRKTFIGVVAVTVSTLIALFGFLIWPTLPFPSAKELAGKDSGSGVAESNDIGTNQSVTGEPYAKEFVLAFKGDKDRKHLDVDIKRGDIIVSSYDGKDVLVKLSIPNFGSSESDKKDGLASVKPRNPDFEIRNNENLIELDSNDKQYTTNLEIKVPRKTDLTLDSYWDGEIRVEGVEGEIRVHSQNNNVTLKGIRGSADVWSYNGKLVASFDEVYQTEKFRFESYNGSIDLTFPSDIQASLLYQTGTGNVLTDFDLDIAELSAEQNKETNNLSLDTPVQAKINGGGQKIDIETEKGDIRIRKGAKQFSKLSEMEKRKQTYEEIKSYVDQNMMPEYLMHAAHAGLLELQRKQAVESLNLSEVYKIDKQLISDYESAISSYEKMMDDPNWKKRFPKMNLRDTKPYRKRLEELQIEVDKRKK